MSLRRLRRRESIRGLIAETDSPKSHLIQPLFVGPAPPSRPVAGLPALVRRGVEQTASEVERLSRLGIRSVLLFGIPRRTDSSGSLAWDAKGPVPAAIRAIRRRAPDSAIVADVCLCGYMSHRHCGVVVDGAVDNERTLPLLQRAAVTYAEAGADLVAPSAMMDHQVASIREALDAAGHSSTGILAYSAKFASNFYGPFRDVSGSAPTFGDRRGYQLPPGNAREALRELRADAAEGADALMVKPALPYLDVLAAARGTFELPLAAFQVSGEYAMIKAAAQRGWVDEPSAAAETVLAIRRAGADFVITYFAGELAAQTGGSKH